MSLFSTKSNIKFQFSVKDVTEPSKTIYLLWVMHIRENIHVYEAFYTGQYKIDMIYAVHMNSKM